jgi:hypothetical protein
MAYPYFFFLFSSMPALIIVDISCWFMDSLYREKLEPQKFKNKATLELVWVNPNI